MIGVRLSEGPVALVTGAASGIGRATALRFGRDGCRVVLVDIDADGAHETLGLLEDSGNQGMVLVADVSSDDEVREVMKRIRDEYGALDIAFNNAGVGGLGKPLHEHTYEEFVSAIAVNLTGVFVCMRHEIELMLVSGTRGAIVNTASALGLVGFSNVSAYVASKHGVVGLTRAAAAEYASSGIRINCVCPGHTATGLNLRFWEDHPDAEAQMRDQLPVGRFGTPEEIAAAVSWLCSDEAAFVHGHALSIDGGMTIV